MCPVFEVSDVTPVPPGESPFHVRGRYYERLLARARVLPGGLNAFLAELRDDAVRDFLRQRFSWNGWYDALPTMPAHAALARAVGDDFEMLLVDGARRAASDLVPRFFRFVVQLQSPQALAARVVAVVLHATDFVQVSFDHVENGGATARGTGIPRYLAASVSPLVIGWFSGMLELGGATNVRGEARDVSPALARDGFEIVTIGYEFRWRSRR